ncbi:hypothetical protein E2C01_026098 [Portunus trituberculatus]|uniref:Uncharacterized protein n=1 Tax=Portunus trituberculatus TaxID=210409 RepID=A0A5B7EEV1_PORTR|nr:hypothetical protein [Portunus trituberculatus]
MHLPPSPPLGAPLPSEVNSRKVSHSGKSKMFAPWSGGKVGGPAPSRATRCRSRSSQDTFNEPPPGTDVKGSPRNRHLCSPSLYSL